MDLKLPQKSRFIGPASVWKRLAAFIIDILILDFFVFSMYETIVISFLGSSSGFSELLALVRTDASVSSFLMSVLSLMALFALVYFILLEYMLGQTPGKIMLNLHILSDKADQNKGNLSFGQCFVRSMFLIPVIPFVFLGIADIIFYFVARKHQRLLDWLSNSRVVEEFSF
jgi:uncharacterized RDD family membrane protein YckC